MNLIQRNSIYFLLSAFVFLIAGNVSFAVNQDQEQNTSFLTEDETEQQDAYNVSSLIKYSEVISPQEYSGMGLSALHPSVERIVHIEKPHHYTAVDSVQDQRRLLSRFLYPFFFFW